MLLEHEHGRGLLRAMSQRDDHAVAEAIRGYSAFLRAHIDKENQILFPLAEQILAAEEQRALTQAFDAMEQVVVGPGIHERLLSKLARIEAAAGGPAGPAGGMGMRPETFRVAQRSFRNIARRAHLIAELGAPEALDGRR
jgi:hypothetical protein